ncbi:PIKK family atypical protein kinase [Trichomonas vaginalis G3]|uniref:non-specific serine/threonine protein kinase n=1 Tax=Trichomonas vaginalis (strain ATCC PRA-98 / G3) TaxID=412133 RepID=A2F4J8_TRIV3|nr:ataxia telangiectasia mutated (ATM) -related family [Trichomonas vaginalis G3]EAY00154.1 PIKK family atypical protein kinase [Trichomonas vaginalis G3]KAI5541119.1 ataxia telangiectasia mutated (ATM) -related family [Trichomonas vaginalis G3]|eukprot:XP_001313083.1 PIKK family atypical protein kinase [Trichomonas vaginalis G3]
MDGGELKISIFINESTPTEYKPWKSHRSEVIYKVGELLMHIEDSMIIRTFDSWEKSLKDLMSETDISKQMNFLLAVSVLHFFQRNINNIRLYSDHIYCLLRSPVQDVYYTATEVLHIIANESIDGIQLLAKPVENAFNWIKETNSSLHKNALRIFMKTKQINELNIIERIAASFNHFYDIIVCDNIDLRRMASRIIHSVLLTISFQSTNPFSKIMIGNFFNKCIQIFSNQTSSDERLHGAVLLIRSIYEFQPTIINEEKQRITTGFIELTNKSEDFLAIDSYNLFLDIGRKTDAIFSSSCLQAILDNLLEKVRESNETESYCDILVEAIKVYDERLDLNKITEFCVETILNESVYNITCQTFKVLATLIERDPDTKFDHAVFNRMSFPDQAIKCLRLMTRVDQPIVDNICEIVNKGLSSSNSIANTIQALKLARVFELDLFDTPDKLYDAISPLTLIDDEKLQLEVIKTIALAESSMSNEFLLNTALFGRYETVRQKAIKKLPATPDVSTNPLLSQILSDPSMEMKKAAIDIIAHICEYNAFLLQAPIFSLVEDIFASISSANNLSRSVELASLLPIIANKLTNMIKPLTNAIIIGCMSCIYPDMQQIEHSNNVFAYEIANVQQKPQDLLKRDGFQFISTTVQMEPTKNSVFIRINQNNLDIRDGYLLQTIAEFAHDITPFLDYALMVFYRIFTTRTNHKLLTVAATSLAKVTSGIGNGLNLRRYCPQFIPALTKVLTTTKSQKTAIAILKLLGTSIDNFDSSAMHSDEMDLELSVDLTKDSYYTDFVLSHLSKYFSHPSDELLEAVTRIFETSPQDAAKFVGQVIQVFIRTIETTKVPRRYILYSELEQITASCPTETEEHLPSLTKCLLQHVSEQGCMLLLACLSYTFMGAFIPFSRSLFLAALGCVIREENVAETLKFIAFSVCYQNQPLSMMLDACEDLMNNRLTDTNARKIAKNLCIIVQSMDSSMQQARIARIVRTLYQIIPKDSFLTTLAFSLAITCKMTEHVARQFIPLSVDTSKLYKALREGVFDIRATDFIEIIAIKFLPTQIAIPDQEKTVSFFDTCKAPPELGMKTWLEDLCSYTIKSSPSNVIRSCYTFVETQVSFKRSLFPVAFLSCWAVASTESRNHFSEVVSQIALQQNHINQTLLQLAEIADRALKPFNVPYDVLGHISESKPLALYFLQKAHQKEPNNTKIVEKLLGMNNTMGRNKSAQGLLAQTSTWRDKASSARWNECLGEWQKALDLYDVSPATLSSRIRCNAHLHKWEQIRQMEDEFWKMSQTDQEINARHLGWAFYHSEDFNKLTKIFHCFPQEPSHSDITLKAVVALRLNKCKDAQDLVDVGFMAIAKNRKFFNGGDANRAAHNLSTAQLLIEISEAIKYKILRNSNQKEVWSRRLKGFKRDGDTWIKLIQIRSLISLPDSDFGVYLKILSVLRREQRWDIIDSYIDKLAMKGAPPEIVLARAKIEWSRGQREEAIDSLRSILNRDMSPNVSAHVHRKLAAYLSQAHPEEMHSVADLYKEATEICANDARGWIGWAYSNNAIAQREMSEDYGINSVSAFLRAVSLSQTGNLEYLILMFATFFKIQDSSKISDQLADDLQSLRSEMIVQVVPQIAVQIAHQDPKIKGIVHKILTKFGNDHFQSIMFPLGMYSFDESKQDPKAQAATDILNKLQKKHKDEAKDAKIFVQGMLDAALTPFERWVIALDEAAQAQREGNTQKLSSLLQKMFSIITQKRSSDLDRRFYKLHGQTIQQAAELFKKNTDKSMSQMWDLLKQLYQNCLDKTNKLEIVLLPRVNEELYTKRDFMISIPGTYSVSAKSEKIKYIDPGLQVLGTQQHPRVCKLISESGKTVKFLLKGSEDLRLDQRVMQFFNLVNSLLRHDVTMRDHPDAAIVEYAIVPLAPSAGLIRWVENADTLHQMICDMRYAYNTSQVPEFDVLNQYTGGLFGQLTTVQKLEAFQNIVRECPANEVRDFLWYRATNAEEWLRMQDNFTLTTALMSMIGYVIGLGDRHPSNIMVQRDTGRVIHIDFGDTFETTINRASYPEKVPFRLTRMIVNALDGGNVQGMFTELCISTMNVLRQNKSSLVALLEIFIHEPLEESSNERSGHLPPTETIARVTDKLQGTDMNPNKSLGVAEQVEILIKEASDYTLYVSHYAGWCPYW